LFNRVLIYRFWGVAETLAVAILNAVTARVTTTFIHLTLQPHGLSLRYLNF